MRSGARVVRVGLVGLVALCAAALLARAFRAVDLRATLRAVMDVGPLAPVALLPFMVAMVLDAAGIRLILRPLGHSVSLARLLPIRIATEALHVTAPAGFVVADSATASLLDTQCGVPVGEGAVLAVARKWLVMRAHAAYIALGAVCGATVLTGVSVRFLGGRWLAWAVCASALIPLSLSLGLGAGFRGRDGLARLLGAVGRIPVRGIRQQVSRWRAGAVAVDGHLGRIGAARSSSWLAAAAFFACWLLESLETAVIVRLVGGPLDLAVAMAAEVGISLVRSIGNVAPAGLGVQEASYVTLLPAMGVPMDTAAAFMLLKRGKELAWIAIGYSLLGAMRRSETVRCARAGELAKI